MLLIYTPHSSPRLLYTMRLFFDILIPVGYEVTHDLAFFISSELPKFSYAKDEVSSAILHFQSSDLLFQNEISIQDLAVILLVFDDKTLKGLFKTTHSSSPFDLFASAFYLVSRYEEYAATHFDEHNRFEAENSIAYKHGFLENPMVNWYALFLKKQLCLLFPDLQFAENVPTVINTVDVDMAWKYKNKGVYRNMGAFFRSLIKFAFLEIATQARVLLGIKKDPFQQFGFLIQESFHIPIVFFWLLGRLGKYDKNIAFQNKDFQVLINDVADSAASGIHLSYQSHTTKNGFENEKQILADITQQSIEKNRFHFLKYSLPSSYQKLLESGITEDYSMGYAKHTGFRASIAQPYFWYDLEGEKTTDLTIYPFVFMDATIRYHQPQKDEWIKNTLESYLDKIIATQGCCIVLWHNDTFESTQNDWRIIYIWWNELVRKKLAL